jgi:putative cardiolipin synthase
MSIVGGRNIGDVYFGFGSGVQFIDADVMVAGPAAADIGADFDRYWMSRSSHPVARIVGDVGKRSPNPLLPKLI